MGSPAEPVSILPPADSVAEGGSDPASVPQLKTQLLKFNIGKGNTQKKPLLSQKTNLEDEAKKKEFVTAVDTDGLIMKEGGNRAGLKLIPVQENSWRPFKKPKNITHPDDESPGRPEDRFEMETMEAGPVAGVRYGLSIREAPKAQVDVGRKVSDLETQQLQEDLPDLPEEPDLDSYDSMPVEDFGEAMLRGMGWEKGKAFGRSNKGLVEPVEYVPRQGRLGLGATPKVEENNKKFIKPGEKRGAKPDLVAAVGPDGRIRNVKGVSEVLVERVRAGVQVGKVMKVVTGRHEGLAVKVLEVIKLPLGSNNLEKARVRLVASEEEVVVRVDELADAESLKEKSKGERAKGGRKKSHALGKKDWEGINRSQERNRRREIEETRSGSDTGGPPSPNRCGREGGAASGNVQGEVTRTSGSHSRSRYDSHTGKQESVRDDERMASDSAHVRERRKRNEDRHTGRGEVSGATLAAALPPDERNGDARVVMWLASHIRVRIVSKRAGGGRLYLKKATVVDVTAPGVCDVILADTKELLQGLQQEALETALPRRGGDVLVLWGPHRGQKGKLVERDSEREVAVVQLDDDFEIVGIALDHVAEYTG